MYKRVKILVTGCCGYIGTTLVKLLLNEGYQVTGYDNLMFNNGDKLLPFITHPNFKFIKGDVRDRKLLKEHIDGNDYIFHLAALVGYSICRERGYNESYSINVDGTKSVIECMDKKQHLIFASTGSNYGEVKDGVCTEETPLNPLSIYGQTKTEAEKYVVANAENFTAFRFATAFGVSPKLRLDLLINDLAYKAWNERYVIVYEPHFLRTFVHIKDIARVFLFAIKNSDKMNGEIYNVGSNKMNFSKREVCEIIKNKINAEFNYSGTQQDADKRNYIVSYDKINSLGFYTTTTIEEGIDELIKAFPLIKIINQYYNL